NKVVRVLVERGDYEIVATQGTKGSLAIVSAGGFLGTNKSLALLQSEKARSFIGDNPGSCMHLVRNILASTPCRGYVEELGFHVPANATRASFVKKALGPAAVLESLIEIG